MDCDGVLTDGRLYFSERGEELKVFHVRDGQGLADWHKAGFHSGIISGRDAGPIIAKRAEELGIRYVNVKSTDKRSDFYSIIEDAGVTADQVAFIGDDINDLPVFNLAGLSVCPSDTFSYIKQRVDLVTNAKGGNGVLREVADLVLASRGELEAMIKQLG